MSLQAIPISGLDLKEFKPVSRKQYSLRLDFTWVAAAGGNDPTFQVNAAGGGFIRLPYKRMRLNSFKSQLMWERGTAMYPAWHFAWLITPTVPIDKRPASTLQLVSSAATISASTTNGIRLNCPPESKRITTVPYLMGEDGFRLNVYLQSSPGAVNVPATLAYLLGDQIRYELDLLWDVEMD